MFIKSDVLDDCVLKFGYVLSGFIRGLLVLDKKLRK